MMKKIVTVALIMGATATMADSNGLTLDAGTAWGSQDSPQAFYAFIQKQLITLPSYHDIQISIEAGSLGVTHIIEPGFATKPYEYSYLSGMYQLRSYMLGAGVADFFFNKKLGIYVSAGIAFNNQLFISAGPDSSNNFSLSSQPAYLRGKLFYHFDNNISIGISSLRMLQNKQFIANFQNEFYTGLELSYSW